MGNSLLESLWSRIDANIGARITQISDLLMQALSANTESKAARDEAVAAAENAQQGAPADGWEKTELAQPVQDSLSRADTALQSIPVATASAPGSIRLSGDLGGTAQAPTVPGLAGKANTSHTHTQAQITGLSTALDGKANATHTHTTSQISGLGTALNGKADKSYVESRPALFSGSGAPPTSIPGATVGDWWLDTSTMELHKITGV